MKASLWIVLLLAASAAARADTAADVRCHETSFSRAAEARDPERFASFIDDDARFIGNDVLRGPSAIAQAWAVFFEAGGPRIRWRPQFVEVLEDGTLALTRGPYRVIAQDEEGNDVERWGTFNSVWRRQPDGGWKVVFDAGSPSSGTPDEDVRALLDAEDACRLD